MRINDVITAKAEPGRRDRPPGRIRARAGRPPGRAQRRRTRGELRREPVEGIVSERDVVRQLHQDPGVLDATVSSIMTTEVHTCAATDLLDDMMRLMTQRRVRHVPVVEDGRLIGIISIGDVVKHKISALEFERDQLDSYVHQT